MKKIILTGTCGRDSESKADKNGNSYTVFSIAILNTKKDSPAEWVEISCGGKLADVARQYVKKGTKVLIEGSPTVNAYQAKDGGIVGKLRVFANNLELLGGGDQQKSETEGDNYVLPESNNLDSDNIPF